MTNGLFVQQSGIEQVKTLTAEGKRTVLVAKYKSYADFFVLLYTLAAHKIDIPFVIGHEEDTPRIKIIDKFLRGSGYIRARRSRH